MSLKRLRRTRSATIAVVMLGGAGCGDSSPAAPDGGPDVRVPPGSVRLAVTTSGIRPDADGYLVSVDGSAPLPLVSDGALLIAGLSPGTHSLELSDNARHCMALEGNPLTFAVASGSTTEVTLTVECGYLVYVGNVGTRDLSVIETVRHTVVATIPNPVGGIGGLAVSPDWRHLYFGVQLKVLDTETHEIVTTVYPAISIFDTAISPDGAFVYSANAKGSLWVVETQSHTLADSIPAGRVLSDVAVSHDGRWAYAPNGLENGRLYRIDLQAGVSLGYRLFTYPRRVATSPIDSRVYVGLVVGSAPDSDAEVIEVEPTRLAPQRSASLTRPLLDIVVSPDGGRLYVAHADQISVLDTNDLSVIGSVPITAARLAITGDGATLYASRSAENEVAAISTSSLEMTASIPVGEQPRSLVVTPP